MDSTHPGLVDARAVRGLTSDRLELGEGLRLLDDGTVVLVDILQGRLFRAALPDDDAAALVELARVPEPLGAVAPLAGRPDAWLAAVGTGFAVLDWHGRLEWLARPAALPGARRRMNDAVCDPAGRMWGGSMSYDGSPGAGRLWRLSPSGTAHEVLSGLTVPNGPVFTPDGRTMYLAHSADGTIEAIDLDPDSGDVLRRREFARLTAGEGSPDGMVLDSEGRVWSAIWGGAEVRCFAPDGGVVTRIPLPAQQPTSVCFTGDRMLVTTAHHGLTDPGPLDGAVLQLPSTVHPVPTPPAVLRP